MMKIVNIVKNLKDGYVLTMKHYYMSTLMLQTKLVKNSISMDNAMKVLFAGTELQANLNSLAKKCKMLMMQQKKMKKK